MTTPTSLSLLVNPSVWLRSVALNKEREHILPPEDIWQRLEKFLVGPALGRQVLVASGEWGPGTLHRVAQNLNSAGLKTASRTSVDPAKPLICSAELCADQGSAWHSSLFQVGTSGVICGVMDPRVLRDQALLSEGGWPCRLGLAQPLKVGGGCVRLSQHLLL